MKIYLGCGPGALHEQHKKVMGDPNEWTFVDYYVHEPHIKNWDARTLPQVANDTVEHIYCSHLLEHLPHSELRTILRTWKDRLIPGGRLTINVPDLLWVCKEIARYEQGQLLEGYFCDFDGHHGLLAVLYGSQMHEGEYHKGGFTKRYLKEILEEVGFHGVRVEQVFEAHEMGCLIAEAVK